MVKLEALIELEGVVGPEAVIECAPPAAAGMAILVDQLPLSLAEAGVPIGVPS